MATIDDIIVWANSLPNWRADAIRRLLETGDHTISDQDYFEILVLAKIEMRLAVAQQNLIQREVPRLKGR